MTFELIFRQAIELKNWNESMTISSILTLAQEVRSKSTIELITQV